MSDDEISETGWEVDRGMRPYVWVLAGTFGLSVLVVLAVIAANIFS